MGNRLVWLIYNRLEAARNKEYIRVFFEEFQRRGFHALLLIEEDLRPFFDGSRPRLDCAGKTPEPPLFVVNRTANFRLGRHMELMGLTVFNSSAVCEMCNDKLKTHRFFSELGLPVLRTEPLDLSRPPRFFPAVVKPVDGKGGDGVFYIKNESEYKAAVRTLSGRICLVQEPADVLGRDVRVYVIGKKPVVSVLRQAEDGFKSNYSLGGGARVYDLSESEAALVNRVINAADFDFVGVDFLFHGGGIAFSELEDPVGARAVYALTDINIAAQFIDYMIGKMKGESP